MESFSRESTLMSDFVFSGKKYSTKKPDPKSALPAESSLEILGNTHVSKVPLPNGAYRIVRSTLIENKTGITLIVQDPSQRTETLFGRREARTSKHGQGKNSADAGQLTLEFTAKITQLCVAPGAVVEPKTTLVRLEAMKMEFLIKAPSKGVVKAFKKKVGDTLQAGELMVDFEAASEKGSQ